MKLIRRNLRKIAIGLLGCLAFQSLAPLQGLAVTGGPSQPEYRSFEPVTTTNMVNPFDGSFTYNIPLLDVPNGYPISLSYHSGEVNNESQASWVGLGWTINPGAINRIKRGFPDEYKNKTVTYHNKMQANWTVTAGASAGMELFGDEDTPGLQTNIGATVRYNNFHGLGNSYDIGFGFMDGIASVNLNYSAGKFGFDPEISPGKIFQKIVNKQLFKKRQTTNERITDFETELKSTQSSSELASKDVVLKGKDMNKQLNIKKISADQFAMTSVNRTFGSNFGYSALAPTSMAHTGTPYDGFSLDLRANLGHTYGPVAIGDEVRITGSFTTQTPKETVTPAVYGYHHNEAAILNDAAMMDYQTENENAFEHRDKYIGLPIPNSDLYSLTGEAMGGTFRPIRRELGHYRKNMIVSNTPAISAGADLKFPLSPIAPTMINTIFSYGGELGGGNHRLLVKGLDDGLIGNFKFHPISYFPNSDENYVLRFTGDLGGDHTLGTDDRPFRTDFHGNTLSFDGWSGSIAPTENLDDRRVGRSGYTAMHFNSDFGRTSNGIRYAVYEKNLHFLSNGAVLPYDRTTLSPENVGEIVTHNEDGVTYVYGLPLHTRNEKSLSYSLKPSQYTDYSVNHGQIVKPITNDLDAKAKRRLGFEDSNTYPSQNLLTQILSPDYVDRTMDGPSPDDFGGYTQFNYERTSGGNGNWYKSRSPYKDLNFSIGQISDRLDDMGSYNYSEREQYYLHSIVSKTHVAIFTTSPRADGVGSNVGNTRQDLITGTGGTGAQTLRKLDKIELYSLADVEKISTGSHQFYRPRVGANAIKTVRLEYYAGDPLCLGTPNHPQNLGKLTLKRVWFEYEGKLPSKIAPYEFVYQYPTQPYPTEYTALQAPSFSLSQQNPSYNVLNSDAWGNYRSFDTQVSSLGNLAPYFPYNLQDPAAYSPTGYDPAAWLLKRIKLPSGGEIHIQYEPHDYHFVQDKRAMVMVPLSSLTSGQESNNQKYYLDVSKLGLAPTTQSEAEKLTREMFEPMAKQQRIFFHFLYGIVGQPDPTPDPGTIGTEFFEGYARIAGYGYEYAGPNAFKPYFMFKRDNQNPPQNFFPIDYGAPYSQKEFPSKVCKEYVRHNLRGKEAFASNGATDSDGNPTATADKFLNTMKALVNAIVPNPDMCKYFDPTMSFVRVQSPKSKIGGGVRVKRLMMYDNSGVGAQVLYGNEYSYKTEYNGEQVSSGVATNETGSTRRENPLVQPIDREEQSKVQAILYGRDMYENEGPIAESMLPGASIGYSRVEISSIHRGPTSTGSEVHEFYTAKDFPVEVQHTDKKDSPKPWKVNIGTPVGSFCYKRVSSSMGYVVKTNEMHGKPKRISKFSAGPYKRELFAEETYEYHLPGSPVSVMDEHFVVSSQQLGKETEILSEGRRVNDLNIQGTVSFDVHGGVLLIPVVPVAIPYGNITSKDPKASLGIPTVGVSSQELRTHVTTKLIHYPAILKRSTNYADGVRNITENVAFDKFTGKPFITKSYDDFSGTYVTQEFKANWEYRDMGQKAENEGLSFSGSFKYVENSGRKYIEFLLPTTPSSTDICGSAANFTKGDLVLVTPGGAQPSNQARLYHVEEVDGANDRIYLQTSGMSALSLNSGSVYQNSGVLVVRSGKTNQLNASMGGLVAHSESGTPAYVNSDPNALSASGNAFLDDLNAKLRQHFANGIPANNAQFPLLVGPYSNMSLELDECFAPGGCSSTGYGSTIQNVQLEVTYNPTTKELEIGVESFEINTSTGLQSFNCSNNGPIAPVQPVPLTPLFTPGCDRGCVVDEPSFVANTNCLGPKGSANDRRCYNGDLSTWVYDWVDGPVFGIGHGPWPLWKYQWTLLSHDNQAGTWTPISNVNSGPFTANNRAYNVMALMLSGGTNNNIPTYGEGLYSFRVNGHGPVGPVKEFFLCITMKYQTPTLTATWSPTVTNPSWSGPLDFDVFNLNANVVPQPHLTQNFQWSVTAPTQVTNQPSIASPSSPNTTLTLYEPGLYHVTAEVMNSLGKCATKDFWINYPDGQACVASIDGDNDLCLRTIPGNVQGTFRRHFTTQNCFVNTPCTYQVLDANHVVIPNMGGSIPNPDCAYPVAPFYVTFSLPGDYYVRCDYPVPNGTSTVEYGPVHVKDCRPPLATIQTQGPYCPDKIITFSAVPQNGIPIDQYDWDFGDGTHGSGQQVQHHFTDCQTHTVTLSYSNQYGNGTATVVVNQNPVICNPVCDCRFTAPARWMPIFDLQGHNSYTFTDFVGQFYLDSNTGQFIWKQRGCATEHPFACISVCGASLPQPVHYDKVVSASAVAFADNWPYDDGPWLPNYQAFNGNEFERGILGNWRSMAQFVYREDIDRNYNFNSGRFGMVPFDWTTLTNDPQKWVFTSAVSAYDPNGNAVEDYNILGIYSTGLYGYNKTLPYAMAQNAANGTVSFEGFENLYSNGTRLEDGLPYAAADGVLDNQNPHTGLQSIRMIPGRELQVASIVANQQVQQEGMIVRAWIKATRNKPLPANGVLQCRYQCFTQGMNLVSKAGEWALYEAAFPFYNATLAGVPNPTLSCLPVANRQPLTVKLTGGQYVQGEIFIDDVRVQPYQAEMACYVYDKAQRLIASFDDQHFAMLMEYNTEGQLVRKLKETVDGIKSVSETQYNVKGAPRQ